MPCEFIGNNGYHNWAKKDVIKNKSHQRRAADDSSWKILYMVGISEPQKNKRKINEEPWN